MLLFFSLMILVGLVMIGLEWFAIYNDSGSFAWLGNKGLAAVAIGIVGLICLWLG